MSGDEVFEYAIGVVRSSEGGFTDDPRDKGNWTPSGELKGTNFGISAFSYPDLDIAALTWEDAKAIYHDDYWQPIGGPALPPAFAVVALDIAINHGKTRLRTWLKEEPHDAVSLSQHRLKFYTTLTTWPIYGKGWALRVFDTLRAAQMLEVRAG